MGNESNSMSGKPIGQLTVGMSAEVTRTYDEWDIFTFAAVTGDLNPAHTDEVFAEETPFRGRVAHGMLTSGLISAVLGTRLPGPGTIYLSQDLKFRRPVRIGDTITAKAEIIELWPEKNIAKLKTICVNQRGEIVLEGAALVMPPKEVAVTPETTEGAEVPASPELSVPVLNRVKGVVSERMNSAPVTIGPSASLTEARELMDRHRVRHLIVLDQGRLVGIITDRDIRQASLPHPPGQPHPEGDPMMDLIRVGQAMTKEVITVTPETLLEHAAMLLIHHRIGALPVVKQGGVVGIITETNLLEAFLGGMGLGSSHEE
jgi:3-hydroxybutyryl-CoA dehydratase